MRGSGLAVVVAVVLALALPVGAAAQDAPAVEITGVTYAEYDAASGTWTLRGAPVVIVRGPTRVEAPEVTYREAAGRLTAAGGVVVHHRDLHVHAERLEASFLEDVAVLEGDVQAVHRRPDGEAVLTAGRVEVSLREGRLHATGGPALVEGAMRVTGEVLTYQAARRAAEVVGAAEVRTPEGRLAAARIAADLAAETAQASGGVRFTGAGLEGEAGEARLDRRGGVAVLASGVVARRGPHTLRADVVTVDLRTGRVVASGGVRWAVSGTGE